MSGNSPQKEAERKSVFREMSKENQGQPCAWSGCDRLSGANPKRYCKLHHDRFRNGRDMDAPVRRPSFGKSNSFLEVMKRIKAKRTTREIIE